MSQRPSPHRDAPADGGGAGGVLRVASAIAGGGLRLAARRPAALLAGIAVLGGAGVFTWNATMKQTARHPAPLFAEAPPTPLPPARPDLRAEPASPLTTGTTRPDLPRPPPRSETIAAASRPAETPRAAEPKRVAEARKPDPKPAVEAKKPEAKPAPAAEARPSVEPRVASAQKALVKLGYGPIEADGLLGSHTRQALERFERDKKLPVTGSLAPRTTRQLASLSGIRVE